MRLKHIMLSTLLVAQLTACAGQLRPDGGEGLLPVGKQVPDLTQVDHAGKAVHLRDPVPTLVYFYPRAGTPGCTKEACALRDAWNKYAEAGLRVVGVSNDDIERQRAFAKEHELPFSLIADPEHVWSKAFGVGTFVGFDARRSFLIAQDERVVHVYEDVDPGVHAAQVLADAKQQGLVRTDAP
jgi:peroxiredoxin Q/BCP